VTVKGHKMSVSMYRDIGAEMTIFTARRSYASAVLGVVILSICPSVTRVLCD